jgi:hypothetical protein
MTDTLTTHPIAPARPLSGQADLPRRSSARRGRGRRGSARRGRGRGWMRRWGRAIAYDVLLVPVGIQTMADAMLDEQQLAGRRWRQLARLLHPIEPTAASETEPPNSRVFGYGLVSAVLGLISWFLLLLLVLAVVRGPFYGLVDNGPYGPGTWGGPTKAGAWAAHAGIAMPSIVALLAGLPGIAWLQAALVRRLDGRATARWVLPATIAVATGGLMFFWSWLQQL